MEIAIRLRYSPTDNRQLGGGFGPGFKIEGGYDFVGDGGKSMPFNKSDVELKRWW